MQTPQRALAALNVAGGALVLASYALAFAYAPEIRSGLWGGVPEPLRPLYTVCMLLAAAGYFPFTVQLVLRISPGALPSLAGVPYSAVIAAYALVLLPSAAWLPLTAELLRDPSPALWWLTRGVLFAVGLGASALLVILWRVARRRGGALAWVACLGCVPFWVQTALLDAIVWPAYFPNP